MQERGAPNRVGVIKREVPKLDGKTTFAIDFNGEVEIKTLTKIWRYKPSESGASNGPDPKNSNGRRGLRDVSNALPLPTSNTQPKSKMLYITKTSRDELLGITLIQTPKSVQVSYINPSGLCSSSGLKAGMFVNAINGKECICSQEASRQLEDATGFIRLEVASGLFNNAGSGEIMSFRAMHLSHIWDTHTSLLCQPSMVVPTQLCHLVPKGQRCHLVTKGQRRVISKVVLNCVVAMNQIPAFHV